MCVPKLLALTIKNETNVYESDKSLKSNHIRETVIENKITRGAECPV